MTQNWQGAPPVLREYLTYMETIMGRSHQTVNEYFLDLRTFLWFMLQKRRMVPPDTRFDDISIETIDLSFLQSVTRTDLLDYLLFAASERPKYHKSARTSYGNQPRARARKVSALRSFYKYLCEKQRYFDENPTASLDTPKSRQTLPKFLTLQESLTLLQSVDGPYKERDYCILTIFLNCGLRVSELVGINLSDINLDDERLRVVGKGNKERLVYLNQACRDAIEAYLPYRVDPLPEARDALFISKQRKRISVQTVKWLVGKHLNEAGLGQKHCSAHKLRHTAATLMYQNGVDVRTLKEVLGHENLDTTMIYTHVVDENLRDAAAKNPLAGLRPPQSAKKAQDKAK